jgi:hypothetical protein
VPEENQQALLAINRQLERLAPVILSGEPKTSASFEIEGGLGTRSMTRQHQRDTYVFALNLDMERRSGRGTVKLAGLKAGTRVEVVDEDRSITADDGRFGDDFGPLAVHIYKLRP